MMKLKQDTPSKTLSRGLSHMNYFINGSNRSCSRALQGVQPVLRRNQFRDQPDKSNSETQANSGPWLRNTEVVMGIVRGETTCLVLGAKTVKKVVFERPWVYNVPPGDGNEKSIVLRFFLRSAENTEGELVTWLWTLGPDGLALTSRSDTY